MEIFFVRHGHALHNQGFDRMGEKAYSSPEFMYSELTNRGHTETRAIRLPTVDAAYVSPLVRCIQTARNAMGYDIPLRLHDGLIESNQAEHPCNVREPKNVIARRYPNVDVSELQELHAPIANESYEALRIRANQTLAQIVHGAWLQGCTRIAIVTHHNWLYALLGKSFRNAEVERVHCSEAEIRERIG